MSLAASMLLIELKGAGAPARSALGEKKREPGVAGARGELCGWCLRAGWGEAADRTVGGCSALHESAAGRRQRLRACVACVSSVGDRRSGRCGGCWGAGGWPGACGPGCCVARAATRAPPRPAGAPGARTAGRATRAATLQGGRRKGWGSGRVRHRLARCPAGSAGAETRPQRGRGQDRGSLWRSAQDGDVSTDQRTRHADSSCYAPRMPAARLASPAPPAQQQRASAARGALVGWAAQR